MSEAKANPIGDAETNESERSQETRPRMAKEAQPKLPICPVDTILMVQRLLYSPHSLTVPWQPPSAF